ncbi:hypothetical protein GBA52_029158 [Prunus armeniaca]|nr:hypothetical protein GBA52_029158 [Prunus armeniaca]
MEMESRSTSTSRCSNGSKFTVQINLESTRWIVQGSSLIKMRHPGRSSAASDLQGSDLKDDQTVQSYGLEADHTVHLVRWFCTASSANPASATNAGAANSTQARGIGSNDGGTLGGSGFWSLTIPRTRTLNGIRWHWWSVWSWAS